MNTFTRELWWAATTRFSLAEMLVLAATAGAGRMAPPTSTKISAGLKCVQGHVSRVNMSPPHSTSAHLPTITVMYKCVRAYTYARTYTYQLLVISSLLQIRHRGGRDHFAPPRIHHITSLHAGYSAQSGCKGLFSE